MQEFDQKVDRLMQTMKASIQSKNAQKQEQSGTEESGGKQVAKVEPVRSDAAAEPSDAAESRAGQPPETKPSVSSGLKLSIPAGAGARDTEKKPAAAGNEYGELDFDLLDQEDTGSASAGRLPDSEASRAELPWWNDMPTDTEWKPKPRAEQLLQQQQREAHETPRERSERNAEQARRALQVPANEVEEVKRLTTNCGTAGLSEYHLYRLLACFGLAPDQKPPGDRGDRADRPERLAAAAAAGASSTSTSVSLSSY